MNNQTTAYTKLFKPFGLQEAPLYWICWLDALFLCVFWIAYHMFDAIEQVDKRTISIVIVLFFSKQNTHFSLLFWCIHNSWSSRDS